MFFMGLYFRIWVDCILRLKSRDVNKNNWKSKSMIIMSTAMTFNLIFIMVIIQKWVFGYFYELNLRFLTGFQNYILTMVTLYFLPCLAINYLFIFRGKRYEYLQEKYPYYNGKLILVYLLTSMILPILLIAIGVLFTKSV